MQRADVLIHINETLDVTERTSLEDDLRKADGGIVPRFNKVKPHLLLVTYDPQAVDTRNLLAQVTAKGYSAQLVGL